MKKVRFESPNKLHIFKMNDSDRHSPRPFIEHELRSSPPVLVPDYPKVLTFSADPIQRYESSNSSPYPIVNRTRVTCLPEKEPCWKPSDDLDLSLLDASNHEPRQQHLCKSIVNDDLQYKFDGVHTVASHSENKQPSIPLSSLENKTNDPPNVLIKDNSFFIKRDNLNKYNFNLNPIQSNLNRLSLGKENNPFATKVDIMQNIASRPSNPIHLKSPMNISPTVSEECRCHRCIRPVDCFQNPHIGINFQAQKHQMKHIDQVNQMEKQEQSWKCTAHKYSCTHWPNISPLIPQNVCQTCKCHTPDYSTPMPSNAVDLKTLAIQKYEQSKQSPSMELEKQKSVSKEKREPTVADLFKIIKLQNEQLQLLQEKVDNFISSQQNVQPTITHSTEHVALNTVENNSRKMSIGVMTSFEMIRTSTVINKEVVQRNEAQIQCNQSEISIKEISKPVNMNFLDGIIPKNVEETQKNEQAKGTNATQPGNVGEEKTLNEISLYNVQVDNATTPLMSPDQTLYLDVRDYSDSEASSNDQSNVGWTYYNKVMTHVNGMLQDSEMPSSASAMYRNLRQQHVQMHIDTTNVSVTKRVKFGDDPLGLHQRQVYAAPATDTSLKMNQLAAKYLNAPPVAPRPAPVATAAIDMSFATRNYMEKHRILQGLPAPSNAAQVGEIPRFLDITALKQQPKFL